MKIIKFEDLPSTNTYLKSLLKQSKIKDYTCIMASNQTDGTGQRGTQWFTEPFKNLTFSIYKTHQNLSIEKQFVLNKVVSVAIHQALLDFKIPNLKVKWPNDIMSANKKIGGILIENTLQSKRIKSSIIGVGLNINQTHFENLPQASSLKKITGDTYNLDAVLNSILLELNNCFKYLEEHKVEILDQNYLKELYRRGQISTFQNNEGHYFYGKIKTVNNQGLLVVELEDGTLRNYDLKQIKLMH